MLVGIVVDCSQIKRRCVFGGGMVEKSWLRIKKCE